MTDYSGYADNANQMKSLGAVFPVLFFLVAALISLTTMTRMVEEERTQIGTLKALGYSKSSIAGKYVFYALLATVGGSVLGVLAGEKIFPYVIIDAYRIMYQHMDGMVLDYQLDHALVASLVALSVPWQERFLPVERNWQVHRRFLCVRQRPKKVKESFWKGSVLSGNT